MRRGQGQQDWVLAVGTDPALYIHGLRHPTPIEWRGVSKAIVLLCDEVSARRTNGQPPLLKEGNGPFLNVPLHHMHCVRGLQRVHGDHRFLHLLVLACRNIQCFRQPQIVTDPPPQGFFPKLSSDHEGARQSVLLMSKQGLVRNVRKTATLSFGNKVLRDEYVPLPPEVEHHEFSEKLDAAPMLHETHAMINYLAEELLQ
mmetsp:Transcript_49900/g.132594  ORF Transcript_49900/g.132594 Transcript_49900/m.132594 type:complete len:200 (+) Transcript_49900:1133-1732(+)